jgi:hypothetical protein
VAAFLWGHKHSQLIFERLSPDYFVNDQLRKIFAAAKELNQRGNPFDVVAVSNAMEAADLTAIGGLQGLAQISEEVHSAYDVAHACTIIQEKATLRRLIYSAAAIQAQAEAATDDPSAILERAQLMLADLREQSGQNSWRDIFETWQEFQNAKPLRSLIENVFQADVCNIIGGLVGDGKTLILLSMTKALLTGKPLFGYFKVCELAARVIYLIPECARAPFFHRAKLFGLEKYLENDRLLVRTLSKGMRIPLSDPRLLQAAKGSVVQIDTAVRFATGGENDAGDVSGGLATDIFALLAAGADAVGTAHHAPKSSEKENRITLENILRGSGDFGAFVGAGFGIRQIDEAQNIIHLEDIKPRDAEPFPPFQIIGRPHINDEGDFRMYRKPNECGRLAEYLDIPGRNKGGAPPEAREARAANVEILRRLLCESPDLTSQQISQRFHSLGIKLGDSSIRKYRKDLGL